MTTTEFFSLAEQLDAPIDQVANFLRARVALTPDQARASVVARSCDRPDGPSSVIHDGSGEPGRPIWGFAQAVVDDCVRVPGLRFLYLIRVEDGQTGREVVEELRRRVLRATVHQYDEVAGRIVLPNGSRVTFGSIRTEADLELYLGMAWDGAVIEGADGLGAAAARRVMSCVRTSKPGWRPRTYLLTTTSQVQALDPDEPNPVFDLIRATADLATVCVAHGWPVERIRSEVFERANRGIPNDGHPAWPLVRSVLARTIDEAILSTHAPVIREV